MKTFKNFNKLLALVLALSLMVGTVWTPALAEKFGGDTGISEPSNTGLGEDEGQGGSEPSVDPTAVPSESSEDESKETTPAEPTEAPVDEVTETPSAEPTETPVAEPTAAPTAEPTDEPEVNPEPTEAPQGGSGWGGFDGPSYDGMPTETPKPTEAPKQDENGTLPGDQIFGDSPMADESGNVIVNSAEELASALSDAADGTTIKVIADLEGVSISADLTGKTITIDLQDNTLTAKTNDVFNFTLGADSTISIMNGTIDGNGRDARGIVINGTAGGDVILAGLTIEGFSSTQEGTALNINGIKDVTISSSYFTGNVFGKSNVRINGHTVYDGKKYVPAGKTTISDSEFSGNTSVMEDSDTVWINGTDVEITNCRFENNTAGNVGGLYLGEAGTISNTTFSGNTGGVAGGLYIKKNVRGNAVYVKGSTFSENHAKSYATKTDDLIAGAIVVDNSGKIGY